MKSLEIREDSDLRSIGYEFNMEIVLSNIYIYCKTNQLSEESFSFRISIHQIFVCKSGLLFGTQIDGKQSQYCHPLDSIECIAH